jgi:hypothetical protein
MALREIREGDAIYYIAELAIANEETLIFTIDVTPLNEASRFSIRFKKQFFVDYRGFSLGLDRRDSGSG